MKFQRRVGGRFSKLGKGRKKKQKWRNPTGRHNKMRNKERGYPATVSIGYGTDKRVRGKIDGKMPKKIYNLKDLEMLGKHEIGILGKIGMKKKMEIAKKAKEMKAHIHNLNIEKILEKKR